MRIAARDLDGDDERIGRDVAGVWCRFAAFSQSLLQGTERLILVAFDILADDAFGATAAPSTGMTMQLDCGSLSSSVPTSRRSRRLTITAPSGPSFIRSTVATMLLPVSRKTAICASTALQEQAMAARSITAHDHNDARE